MKIKDILDNNRTISCEFFPPRAEEGIPDVFSAVERLKAYRPDFVSVTYGAGGSTRAFTERITSEMKQQSDLEVMAHLTCVGQTKEEIHGVLERLDAEGVENIIALPTDMFYNTGIATYVWVLSNHKAAERQGKVQLIDGSQHFAKMRKSLGSKRQYITEVQISDLVRLYGRFEETPQSKIFPVEAFGYRRITVERPLRLNFQANAERIEKVLEEKAIQKMDAAAQHQLVASLRTLDASVLHRNREQFSKLLKKTLSAHDVSPSTPELKAILNALSERDPEADICTIKGKPEPDTGLRDNENVPLGESVYDYFEREVKPHVPDAWIDESKTDAQDGEVGIVGFEIPFNRHFYVFQPPRPLEEIDRDLKACTDRIKQMIEGLSA